MTDSIKEQVSACLDGELPDRELPLLLKRIGQDAELCATMTRYSLISEVLRGGSLPVASTDFAARTMARIAAEPRPQQARTSQAAWRRLRTVAGLGIAASVATLALITAQRVGLTPTGAETTSIVAQSTDLAAEVAPDRYVVPMTPSSSSAFIPATRLTNYVVAHSEYSSPLGRRSVLSGVLAEGEAELLTDAPAESAAVSQESQP
jgi:sigma-E factor negative regulatory protein RseA